MGRRIRAAILSMTEATAGVRAWLSRVMPVAAAMAALLFVLRMLLGRTALYGEHPLADVLRFLTVAAVIVTLLYYGSKGLLWLKRRLLWRVRRRLVITYLFVGLTPIVLFLLLGLLSAFGGSNQAMSRIVAAQFNTTERHARENARALADAFTRLPPNTDVHTLQSWLDERAGLLQASLPGARLALWRSDGESRAAGFEQGELPLASEPKEGEVRGVGSDTTPPGSPLPDWLREHEEWSGLAYMPPEDEQETFSSPSVRAIVRGVSGGRAFTILLVVPINRALVRQYRESTGINVRPFFLNARLTAAQTKLDLDLASENETRTVARHPRQTESRIERAFRQDQFGEPINGQFYVVVLPSTNWLTGEARPNLAFIFDWSWALAGRQFLGGGEAGALWWQAFKYVGLIFLVLELLALLAAVWMTRAVTGTVHRLYRATEYIKRGDFSHRVHVRSRDQLGELAESFNDMSANVESLLHERVERERLEREVEIAAEVQAQLFPRSVPELSTLEISAECRAARGVAGDYYDYMEVTPGLIALALGDVAGKGVSAALVMSNLQAALRAQATITAERLSLPHHAATVAASGSSSLTDMADEDSLTGALSRMTSNINRQLCQSTEANRFATLFLALYEDETRLLRYTNAGHNAPLLVRLDGTVEELSVGGLMVGAFDWAKYEEASIELRRGDVLVIYSDGITESERAPGEEYGIERLRRLVVARRELSAAELRQTIFKEIEDWAGHQERNDDQTLVIVKSKN